MKKLSKAKRKRQALAILKAYNERGANINRVKQIVKQSGLSKPTTSTIKKVIKGDKKI